tara:strand:- start:416 stop:568 length:153 start_codon:yes stop_codon:yes gene_type:complete
MIDDTVKTTITGLGSAAVVGLGILPDLVSVLVGLTTILYLVLKMIKEFKK